MGDVKKILACAKQVILDILFPFYCLGCGREGILLCDQCSKTIEYRSQQVCPRCEKRSTVGGRLCDSCRKENDYPLPQLLVAAEYRLLLPQALHQYKYQFVTDYNVPLAKVMLKALQSQPFLIPDYIIAMPLHRKKLRQRGFNQSLLLAQYISQNLTPWLDIPVLESAVYRIKNTAAQMSLKHLSERKANLKDAFSLNPAYAKTLKGKKLLLIDDICTTGTTLLELSKELQRAQPYSITAVVLARQS